MVQRRRLHSPAARIWLGQWAGLTLALVSPKQPTDLQELVDSIQIAHRPQALLGVIAISEQQELPGNCEMGTLYCLNATDSQESSLIERLAADLPHLANTEIPISSELMTLLGVQMPSGSFPQRSVARRFGHVVGKLLKRPKQLLDLPNQQMHRLEAQLKLAEHLEKAIFKARSNDN